MPRPLSRAFFERPALVVARELLGCRLCRRRAGAVQRWPITETEAYTGPDDKACHAHRGRTPRTSVMFGPSGIWYVYFCYGMHWMLNVVTCPAGHPAAVLIRGAGDCDGPGKLTRALGINGALNGLPAVRATGLWIEPGEPVPDAAVTAGPRIGVAYAGPDWSLRPYRFVVSPGRLAPD